VILDEPSSILVSSAFEQAIKPDRPLRELAGSPVLVDGIPPQVDQRGTGGRATLVKMPASLERLRQAAKSSIIKMHPRAEVHMVALSHEPAKSHEGGM
jgi:hypothetical protein